jgi:hypothetical protein
MFACQDENANQNIRQQGSKPMLTDPVKSHAALGDKKLDKSEGRSENLTFGPSLKEWLARREAARHGGGRQTLTELRSFGNSPAPSPAGRKSGTVQSSRRHFLPSKDLLFEICSDNTEKPIAKRQTDKDDGPEALSTGTQNELSCSSRKSEGETPWSQSLRERAGTQPWTPHVTVPRGPRFTTPTRSRSTSRGSRTPGNMTPREASTPEGRPVTWQESLRGRSLTPQGERGSSTTNTPQPRKKGRRSLSHWWAESSAPPKLNSHSSHNSSTPAGIPMTPEAEDELSESSVTQPFLKKDPVKLLNNMSRQSQRRTIERKRRQMDELSQDQLPSERSVILDRNLPVCPSMTTTDLGPQCTGNQFWLRSLRRGRSCPPSAEKLTEAQEPCMRTAFRARHRAELSVERSTTTSITENLRPRERAAIEKHLERAARSRSTNRDRSASATPERRREVPQPRETPERRREVPQPRERSPLRAPKIVHPRERDANPRCAGGNSTATRDQSSSCPFSPREQAALEKHLERLAAATSSAQSSGHATPEPSRSECLSPEQDEESPLPAGGSERQGPASCAMQSQTVRVHERSKSRATPSTAQTAGQVAASSASQVENSETAADEQWVRKAANPEERAERAKVVSQAKFERARAHERARVCVFKRPGAGASGAAPGVATRGSTKNAGDGGSLSKRMVRMH